MKANHTEASELGDFLGNTAKSAMIGKIIAAPLKYAGDAWTKFSLANPNYYVPSEFGSAVSKLEYLDEIASGQLTTTSSRVAAQTTAAKLRKEIILKSGMDKSEILKFCGDGDDILAIIDEMDNVVGVEGGVQKIKATTELEAHIKNIDPTVPRKRGIGGAHNSEEFLKNDVQVVSRRPHADIEGIEILEYQMPKLDKTAKPILGEYQTGKPLSKTIYDPSIISDSEFINRGVEAANNALLEVKDANLPRIWTGIDSQGVTWRGYYENGTITSFYPE